VIVVELFSTGTCCRGCSAIQVSAGAAAESLRGKVGRTGESVRSDADMTGRNVVII
jgi:hypothetical protein